MCAVLNVIFYLLALVQGGGGGGETVFLYDRVCLWQLKQLTLFWSDSESWYFCVRFLSQLLQLHFSTVRYLHVHQKIERLWEIINSNQNSYPVLEFQFISYSWLWKYILWSGAHAPVLTIWDFPVRPRIKHWYIWQQLYYLSSKQRSEMFAAINKNNVRYCSIIFYLQWPLTGNPPQST